jgi:alkylhydroperoxidase family enzyme
MDINAAGGSEAGASPEKIGALANFRASDLFTPAEQVALELAEAATALPHDVSDQLFARLREHYSDAEIVELSYIIALENFRSRFNRTLRVEAQGLYCLVPERRPART